MTLESYFISRKIRFIRVLLMDNITSYCYPIVQNNSVLPCKSLKILLYFVILCGHFPLSRIVTETMRVIFKCYRDHKK